MRQREAPHAPPRGAASVTYRSTPAAKASSPRERPPKPRARSFTGDVSVSGYWGGQGCAPGGRLGAHAGPASGVQRRRTLALTALLVVKGSRDRQEQKRWRDALRRGAPPRPEPRLSTSPSSPASTCWGECVHRACPSSRVPQAGQLRATVDVAMASARSSFRFAQARTIRRTVRRLFTFAGVAKWRYSAASRKR